jgi:hypothetical protein
LVIRLLLLTNERRECHLVSCICWLLAEVQVTPGPAGPHAGLPAAHGRLKVKDARQAVFRIRIRDPNPDPDPPDPHVFGPSGSRSISQRYGSGSRSWFLLTASRNSKKNLDSYCFVTSFGLFMYLKIV